MIAVSHDRYQIVTPVKLGLIKGIVCGFAKAYRCNSKKP